MLAYKGFDPGLICRGYQFVMGLNTTEKAKCVANGFHCAANPLDCLTYYSNMDRSEYYLVDAGGDIDEDDIDSKISCTHLTILRKLSRKEFCLHALAYMVDHPKMECNSHVQREFGETSAGFAIVRGKNPKAIGHKGAILALAKEYPQSIEIEQIGLVEVDGETILPGVWYDIDFTEKEVNAA